MIPHLPAQLAIEPLTRPFDVTITDLPGSKSLTNRALLLAALAEGTSTLTNVLFSDDARVMMRALEALGFKLDIDEPARTVRVEGRGGAIPAKSANLHLGNAGTAMRFLTAACCLGEPGSVYTLDGIPRMRQRPIGELVEPLRQLGAKIEYLGDEGYPPLRIHGGGLAGGELTMKPTLSSQFISALLQIGPYLSGGLELRFDGPLTSWPYVNMTRHLMYRFGANQPSHDRTCARVDEQTFKAVDLLIEPDASNASYFLAAAAIIPGSQVTIRGIGEDSIQGDTWFADQILKSMGAEYDSGDDWIQIKGVQQLIGINDSLFDMPDMAQTIAVVAMFAQGPTTIRNVGNLRVKETDRIAALQNELAKLGATVTVTGDDITITPPPGNQLRPATIDTYDDHRMAMAFAVAGLRSPGVVINDPSCVSKTFPDYFEYLGRLRG